MAANKAARVGEEWVVPNQYQWILSDCLQDMEVCPPASTRPALRMLSAM